MKKIPLLLETQHQPVYRVLPYVRDEFLTLFTSNLQATRKWDGTAALHLRGEWYLRHQFKNYQKIKAKHESKLQHFILEQYDPQTDKAFGWLPAQDKSDHVFLQEALEQMGNAVLPDGTYELIGPKINGNHEQVTSHQLKRHGETRLNSWFPPYEQLNHYLEQSDDASFLKDITPAFQRMAEQHIEGVVFWKNNQPVAKLRVKDIRF